MLINIRPAHYLAIRLSTRTEWIKTYNPSNDVSLVLIVPVKPGGDEEM